MTHAHDSSGVKMPRGRANSKIPPPAYVCAYKPRDSTERSVFFFFFLITDRQIVTWFAQISAKMSTAAVGSLAITRVVLRGLHPFTCFRTTPLPGNLACGLNSTPHRRGGERRRLLCVIFQAKSYRRTHFVAGKKSTLY